MATLVVVDLVALPLCVLLLALLDLDVQPQVRPSRTQALKGPKKWTSLKGCDEIKATNSSHKIWKMDKTPRFFKESQSLLHAMEPP